PGLRSHSAIRGRGRRRFAPATTDYLLTVNQNMFGVSGTAEVISLPNQLYIFTIDWPMVSVRFAGIELYSATAVLPWCR
ncbi:hypothetical protein, partial [Nocardia abscessus]|uniref:hypothetical protein n=1 Tax=Nocardia abscessus TaxID=120957 RepID=UPI002455DF30